MLTITVTISDAFFDAGGAVYFDTDAYDHDAGWSEETYRLEDVPCCK
jgi:hypothetical protein